MLSLSRKKKLFSIFQVDLTSFCNMKCSYCPHPTMERTKGHMSEETLDQCINYAKKVGQKQLVVHHFGEPLMHPKLQERLMQVADAGLEIEFSTNGLLLEKKLPLLFAIPTKIYITLSMHQWADQPHEEYLQVLKAWKKRVAGTNLIMQKAFNVKENGYELHEWTQGEKKEWNYYKYCHFLRDNEGVVLADGRVVSCCADIEGESVFAHISDTDLSEKRTRSWAGCDTCDLMDFYRKPQTLRLRIWRIYHPILEKIFGDKLDDVKKFARSLGIP